MDEDKWKALRPASPVRQDLSVMPRNASSITGSREEQAEVLRSAILSLHAKMLNTATPLARACFLVNEANDSITIPEGMEEHWNSLKDSHKMSFDACDMAPLGFADCKEFLAALQTRLKEEIKEKTRINRSGMDDEQKNLAKQYEEDKLPELITQLLVDKYKVITPARPKPEIEKGSVLLARLVRDSQEMFKPENMAIFEKAMHSPELAPQEEEFIRSHEKFYRVMQALSSDMGFTRAAPFNHLNKILNEALEAFHTAGIDMAKLRESQRLLGIASGIAENLAAHFVAQEISAKPVDFPTEEVRGLQTHLRNIATLPEELKPQDSQKNRLSKAFAAIKDPAERVKAKALYNAFEVAFNSLPDRERCYSLAADFKPGSADTTPVDPKAVYSRLNVMADMLDGITSSMRNLYVELGKTTGNANGWETETRHEMDFPNPPMVLGLETRAFAEALQHSCKKVIDGIAPYVAREAPMESSVYVGLHRMHDEIDPVACAMLNLQDISNDIATCNSALAELLGPVSGAGAGRV